MSATRSARQRAATPGKAAARAAPAGTRGSELTRVRRAATALLTLAAPERRNSLSEGMLQLLRSAIDEAAGDPEVRAVVIAAEGSVFSSGHDLKELTGHRQDVDGGRAYYRRIMRLCTDTMGAAIACPKPVIAAVEGAALAAGCQLVATCDLAVAGEGARFCTPGVNIGLFCSTPMVALSRNVARKRAMEMLLFGDMLPAAAALEFGLVNRVVPVGQALSAALALADRFAELPAATLAMGKRAFYRQLEMPLDEAYALASAVMVDNMLTAEAAEGIGAFIAKRPPLWPPPRGDA
jgi:enoyl-CoA hydratase/carnithine racemase